MNWDTDILSLGIFLERCGTAVRRLWVNYISSGLASNDKSLQHTTHQF
jgi:hypothetical protein